MDINIDKGEVKEKTLVTYEYIGDLSNIRSIQPLCDCMSYVRKNPTTYEFSFTTDPVPNNKDSYETTKVIILKYKDDDIAFVNIKCNVTR